MLLVFFLLRKVLFWFSEGRSCSSASTSRSSSPPSVRERRPLLLLAASPVELPPSRISNPGAGARAPCEGRNLPQVADPRFGVTVRVLRANAAVVRTRVVVTGGSVLTRSSDEPGPEKRG